MKLKLIYAIHMLAPLSFVYWHIDRLAPDTVRALLAFGVS
jgi:hypothetical protein